MPSASARSSRIPFRIVGHVSSGILSLSPSRDSFQRKQSSTCTSNIMRSWSVIGRSGQLRSSHTAQDHCVLVHLAVPANHHRPHVMIGFLATLIKYTDMIRVALRRLPIPQTKPTQSQASKPFLLSQRPKQQNTESHT